MKLKMEKINWKVVGTWIVRIATLVASLMGVS